MTISQEIEQAMEKGMTLMFIEGFLAEWKRNPVQLRAEFEQAATRIREKREAWVMMELKKNRRKYERRRKHDG